MRRLFDLGGLAALPLEAQEVVTDGEERCDDADDEDEDAEAEGDADERDVLVGHAAAFARRGRGEVPLEHRIEWLRFVGAHRGGNRDEVVAEGRDDAEWHPSRLGLLLQIRRGE